MMHGRDYVRVPKPIFYFFVGALGAAMIGQLGIGLTKESVAEMIRFVEAVEAEEAK